MPQDKSNPFVTVAGRDQPRVLVHTGEGQVTFRVEFDRNPEAWADLTMTRAQLQALLETLGPEPEFTVDTGETPFHCQDCGHKAEEVEFWPSDGNPADVVCPKCGRTNCFPTTPGEEAGDDS